MTHAETRQPTERIVVGIDGSPASIDALRWAMRQGELTAASVEAVTAWHLPVSYGDESVLLITGDWKANADALLDAAIKEAVGDQATSLVRRLVQGHPVTALLGAATGADLLVVGSRGHGGFAGMLLGSVSQHLVAHAPCAVVVIRHVEETSASTVR
jgi:nucleotide-binding universal stress UspA family protein